MPNDEAYNKLTNAQSIVDWFGHWPGFHDAEVLDVELHRRGQSFIRVHAFRMTAELDSRGYYVCDRHAIITFVLEEITSLSLSGFNGQNVLAGLGIEEREGQICLVFEECFGVEGHIAARRVSVNIAAGLPDGIYSRVQA